MNLDDFTRFNEIDPQDMLSQIDGLPDQLGTAWEIGLDSSLPSWTGISTVLIAGMGGSAIGADLLTAFASPIGSVPIFVHRDYDLPAWVKGSQTLVIASSHSGDTEETLSALETALNRRCRCLVISTGGKIAQHAKSSGIPVWRFEHEGQPRAAVGYSFTLLLAVLFRLNLIPNPSRDLIGTIDALRGEQTQLMADISIANNPAKRTAGQLLGLWVTVMGSGLLAPVARRWKGQISEIAKAWAQFEFLPEANHNTLAGIQNPEDLLSRIMVLFLRAPSDHPRNRLRADLTRKTFMLEGLGTDFIDAQGETPMAHLWTCLHFGDYMAYYLAMAYEVNPTLVTAIENFKTEMGAEGE
ncbi:bifunctional phosphoglucose/phosphomannose isomerase [Chloroflexota bacterium]